MDPTSLSSSNTDFLKYRPSVYSLKAIKTFSHSRHSFETDQARPLSVQIKKSGGATGDAGPARRVQIFNSSDSFSPDQARELTVFAKPESSKTFLREALSVHYLFESLGAEDMARIVDCMRPTFANVGETIIKQGDEGDLFFCLESGSASATVEGVGEVMTYAPGGCFGELALIYNSPRAASITATNSCKLWALDLRWVHIVALFINSLFYRL